METASSLEQQLLEYRAILDHAGIAVILTRARHVVRCNRRAEELFRWPAGELAGQPGRVFYPDDGAYDAIRLRASPALAEGRSFETDLELARRDGSTFIAHVIARAIDHENPESGTIWIVTDVTRERQESESANRLLQEQNLIFDNAMIGISYQRDRTILRCNRRMEEIFGWPPGSLTGQSTRVLFAGDAEWAEAGSLVYQPGLPPHTFDGVVRYARKDGSPIWVRVVGRTIETRDGGVTWIWTFEDVTERRNAEVALNQTMREYALIFENALIGVAYMRGRVFLRCNRRLEEMFGFPAGGLAGRSARVLFASDEDFAATGRRIEAETRGGKGFSGEIRYRHRGGHMIWVLAEGRSFREGDHELWVWTLQDVTEQHEAEQALMRSHAELERRVAVRTDELAQQLLFLRQLIEAIPGPVFYKDRDGRYLGCNRAYADYVGIPGEELVGQSVFDIAPPELAVRYKASDDALFANPGSEVYEAQVKLRNGELRDVMFHKATFSRVDGEVGGLVGVMLDITERKRAEAALAEAKRDVDDLNASLERRVAAAIEELQQSHRSLLSMHEQLTQSETMASLGRMVAVIAHELNTPIGNSRLAASTLREQSREFSARMAQGVRRSDLDALLRSIDTGTRLLDGGLQRAAHLISSFKQIAVDQTSAQRRPFALDDLIDEISTTMEPGARRAGCTIEWDVEPEVTLDSYPGPLGHVLINLIDNAVRHAFVGRSAGTIRVSGESRGSEEIVLQVVDDGVGVKAADRKRVFEPFFTTQLGRGGTGLGLSIAYNIVNGVLGGRITLTSEPDQGACFTVQLPKSAPLASRPAA
jgi:PAS domain S-box-containing protein